MSSEQILVSTSIFTRAQQLQVKAGSRRTGTGVFVTKGSALQGVGERAPWLPICSLPGLHFPAL